ncbi:zinc knuckle [Ancylostoma caninum]|uniref:Zinc knuckle n=1 Tax=Ancylostoma caninum TaxID=29170 RepID=A0A368HB39_ANCCA|nr:zinc knuckle [Ancylostoma caninum]
MPSMEQAEEVNMEDAESSQEPNEQVRLLPVNEFGLIRRVLREQLSLTGMSAQEQEHISRAVSDAVSTVEAKGRAMQAETIRGTQQTASQAALLSELNATPAEVKQLLSMASTQAGVINVVKQKFSCDLEDIVPEIESRERQMSEKQAEIVALQLRVDDLQRELDEIADHHGVGDAQSMAGRNKGSYWEDVKVQIKGASTKSVVVEQPLQHGSTMGIRPTQPRNDGQATALSENYMGSSRSSSNGSSQEQSSSKSTCIGHGASHLDIVDVMKEVLKAQAAPQMPRYSGARRCSPFPCRAQEKWDHLAKRDEETVVEFCARLEKLARTLDKDGSDFELGSKLYKALQHWSDSYYMLAALDAPRGYVYESVKTVALRLERTSPAKGKPPSEDIRSKRRNLRNSRFFRVSNGPTSKDISASTNPSSGHVEQQTSKKRTPKCYSCAEEGHIAAECPRRLGPKIPARKELKSHSTRQAPNTEMGTDDLIQPGSSFTTYLNNWCKAIQGSHEDAERATTAYGEPCICDVEIFGMRARALVDTGSIITIVPVGLLKRTRNEGIDLDSKVTMIGKGGEQRIVDASGNPMQFHMIIEADVKLVGSPTIKAQMHVHPSSDEVLLLGTNVLGALGVRVQMPDGGSNMSQPRRDAGNPQRDAGNQLHGGHTFKLAKAQDRVVIPPNGSATIELTGDYSGSECIFWSNRKDIASGVCRKTQGTAPISVVNKTEEPWVIKKGETLGKWSDEKLYEPQSADIPGDMMVIKRPIVPYKDREEMLCKTLSENRMEKTLPRQLREIIVKHSSTFALSDIELGCTDMICYDIELENGTPIRQKTRPVPYGIRPQVSDLLADLKERKIIEESHSPWASPIVLVVKKDGSIRLSQRSAADCPGTIDFKCPGHYQHGDQQIKCPIEVPFSKLIRDPPIPELTFTSVYDLARAIGNLHNS